MTESILGVLLHRTWHGKCTGKRTQTIVQRRKLKHLSVTLSVYATSLLHPLTSLSHPVLHSQAASGSAISSKPSYNATSLSPRRRAVLQPYRCISHSYIPLSLVKLSNMFNWPHASISVSLDQISFYFQVALKILLPTFSWLMRSRGRFALLGVQVQQAPTGHKQL